MEAQQEFYKAKTVTNMTRCSAVRQRQPTPLNPFEPVTVRKFFTGMFVNPAKSVNGVDAPADPEMKSLFVLTSPVMDSEPLSVKKFALPGSIPFCVKPTAMTFEEAPVFLIVKNLVT